ncbi:MAG TPA: amidase [Acidimicrobiales bacterium]|nr:amidase [Acidimicrobiales bacterium]
MADIGFMSATELVGYLRRGEVSSREVLEHYLARIATHNPALRAVVTMDADRARDEADEADRALTRGEFTGRLHGLPMTVKDQFATSGMRTTFGNRTTSEYVPNYDSVPVARLRAAGAVIFGKTNLPPMGADVQTYNRQFGTTNNPWDPARTPGGSSGGSAAAVAAALTGLELGGDIAGSIRIPAHYCGVYGHKPSFGVVADPPGVTAPPGYRAEPDIATPGPLARSADDLELALDVLAGPDPARAAAWHLDLPPARRAQLADYRVTAWLDDPDCPTDPEVLAPLRGAVQSLRAAGVAVDETARPAVPLKDSFRNFQKLLYGALSHGLPFTRGWPARWPWMLTPPVPGDNQLSRVLRYGGASHRDWILAHEAREEYRRAWAAFFERHDILLCPVSPVAAIAHNHRFGGAIIFRTMRGSGHRRRYVDQMMWNGMVGQAYLPATVAPVGRTAGGLPVGIQIVGPYLEDRTTIDFARRLGGVRGGFEPPPVY